MKVIWFLSIALSLIVIGTFSCKKTNTTASCGSSIVCVLLDGNTYAGDAYAPNATQLWQGGSYGILTETNGQLTIIGGNFSSQSYLSLNILTSAQQGATYSPSKGNMTCTYVTPNPNNVTTLTQYVWKDSTSNGTLTITTLDSVNNIVSGTFTGLTLKALENQTPATHTLTSGYFTGLTLTY